MSILFENGTGTLLSTEDHINSTIDMEPVLKINPNLFKILSPYSKKSALKKTVKRTKPVSKDQEVDAMLVAFEKEALNVQEQYSKLLPILRSRGFLKASSEPHSKNTDALKTADFVYEESGKHLIKDAVGSNFGPVTIKTIQNCKYVFPENCQFFCKDVNQIDAELENKQFDLIVLDPPWWNKYIRRKRKKCPYAYNMMYNCDLKKIPIEKLLHDTGIVVVWCTNSPQHLNYLIEDIFPKWKVSLVAKWYWLKVTVHGEPICEFSKPPGKQPFEQILIGYRDKQETDKPSNGKLLVSVPSAIHSHKPPLVEVLQPFLPANPKSLEIFARYLLPNWTSYGNEVLRFQHESLYTFRK